LNVAISKRKNSPC